MSTKFSCCKLQIIKHIRHPLLRCCNESLGGGRRGDKDLHCQSLDLLLELDLELLQGRVLHLDHICCHKTPKREAENAVTYRNELFHRNQLVVEDASVDGAEAPLPQPAAALRDGPVVKAVRDLHQVVVGDAGETYGGICRLTSPPLWDIACLSTGARLWVLDHGCPAGPGSGQGREPSASLSRPAAWLEGRCTFLLMEALAAVLLLGRHLSKQKHVCASQKMMKEPRASFCGYLDPTRQQNGSGSQ